MTVAAPSTNGTRTTSRPAAPRPSQRPPSALELNRSTDRAVEAPAPTSAPEAPQAQPSGFSPEQLAALSAPLDRANVRQREQGRSKVYYLEGWQVIAEANRIFGFDGWQRQTIAVRCVAQAERLIGARGTSREQKPGWGVTYTARVRVTVTAGGLTPLVREGSGAGHGIDVDLGQAHESALKEAETDAMKRALMTFGNPFGLALYDKAQRQVSSAAGQGDGLQRQAGQRSSLSRPEAGSPAAAAASPAQRRTQATDPTPPPSAQADLGQVALDTETIQHLHSTLRTLPRPLLESLTRAFRKRFQVPEAAATIADRINQKCHHDWIETFLVSHRELRSTSQHQRQPGRAAQPLS